MGPAPDKRARQLRDQAAAQELHRRQDGGTCPAIAPLDCQRQDVCCPLSSECVAMADGGTGCVVSNNFGQTLTLTPRPKETPSSVPASTSTVPSTEPTSTDTVPVPTTPTESTTVPSPIPVTDTSTFITSLPTGPSTTQSTDTSVTSPPSVETSSTITDSGTTLTSVATSSSSTTIGGGAATSKPAPGNAAKEANLTKGETVALVAVPLGGIFLALIAYFIWRRRTATSETSETAPLSKSRRDYLDEDDQPIADTPLNRRWGSFRSMGTQPSVATTDILLRGSEDSGGPLRSHPLSAPAMMLGAIPQSPLSVKSEKSSFKSAVAKHESEESSGSSPILAPFGQEYMHGHIRYSSSPMKYVTKLDAPPSPEARVAIVEGSQASSSTAPQTKHMSWMMNPFGRSSASAPGSSRIVEPSDWISPPRMLADQRVVSLPSVRGEKWEAVQTHEGGSL